MVEAEVGTVKWAVAEIAERRGTVGAVETETVAGECQLGVVVVAVAVAVAECS